LLMFSVSSPQFKGAKGDFSPNSLCFVTIRLARFKMSSEFLPIFTRTFLAIFQNLIVNITYITQALHVCCIFFCLFLVEMPFPSLEVPFPLLEMPFPSLEVPFPSLEVPFPSLEMATLLKTSSYK